MTLRLTLFTLLCFSISCTNTVPNVKICADKAKFGAVCAMTRDDTKAKIQVSKIDWDAMRVGWFCMDAKALGAYQDFIEKVCAQEKDCVDQINAFSNNLTGGK